MYILFSAFNAKSCVGMLVYTCIYASTFPSLHIPPLRSVVVRASARDAGGRGSIPARVTPKTYKMGGLRFSAWRLALMS